ncbi:hypothetical protein BSZ07_01610 [Streptomyces sp. M1013]|nr:hypothetical protein BSZ07_01610 [Streptomyces sp. M1013]
MPGWAGFQSAEGYSAAAASPAPASVPAYGPRSGPHRARGEGDLFAAVDAGADAVAEEVVDGVGVQAGHGLAAGGAVAGGDGVPGAEPVAVGGVESGLVGQGAQYGGGAVDVGAGVLPEVGEARAGEPRGPFQGVPFGVADQVHHAVAAVLAGQSAVVVEAGLAVADGDQEVPGDVVGVRRAGERRVDGGAGRGGRGGGGRGRPAGQGQCCGDGRGAQCGSRTSGGESGGHVGALRSLRCPRVGGGGGLAGTGGAADRACGTNGPAGCRSCPRTGRRMMDRQT